MSKVYDWELVNKSDLPPAGWRTTHRLRVPGGWLYKVEVDVPAGLDSRQTVVALQFVPRQPRLQDSVAPSDGPDVKTPTKSRQRPR